MLLLLTRLKRGEREGGREREREGERREGGREGERGGGRGERGGGERDVKSLTSITSVKLRMSYVMP